jgi:hypothetical protein
VCVLLGLGVHKRLIRLSLIRASSAHCVPTVQARGSWTWCEGHGLRGRPKMPSSIEQIMGEETSDKALCCCATVYVPALDPRSCLVACAALHAHVCVACTRHVARGCNRCACARRAPLPTVSAWCTRFVYGMFRVLTRGTPFAVESRIMSQLRVSRDSRED